MKVYVTPVYDRAGQIYHTDENCKNLTDHYNEKELELLGDHWNECQLCSGEADHSGSRNWEIYNALNEGRVNL